MATQIERNAAVVADLAGADWQVAYVIACSVENKGRGGDQKSGSKANSPLVGKVSGAEFARMVKAAAGGAVYGLGSKGILARLARWDEFADEWDIKYSENLTPADAKHYPNFPDIPFSRQDGATGEDESSKGKVRDVKNNAAAVAEALEDPSFAAKVSSKASPKAKSNMVDAALPPIAPVVDDFRGGSNAGDVISSAVASEPLQKARQAIADVHRLNKAGKLEWSLIDKGYWEQIVNMVAAVTMTIDLSDVHSLIDAEGK